MHSVALMSCSYRFEKDKSDEWAEQAVSLQREVHLQVDGQTLFCRQRLAFRSQILIVVSRSSARPHVILTQAGFAPAVRWFNGTKNGRLWGNNFETLKTHFPETRPENVHILNSLHHNTSFLMIF